ncbi:UDP-N-acetylglucosamine--undecaprenyl-phosphate N-acetylglucosaminephosphotransferase [Marinobacter sp. CHS3-4]|uniref:UDP-N-acetylglucosamine--undecaprenyl-phosphate N-acetylglucosaminephosphotransferase n=1 Tax=Marinobacter sp. CHS3-4 TaxID=3045174 RepID=UPI0024B4E718|nr:UDP-N-acetylglucosamine--undecaprenyl-phosphate N-acetylglucosaminephosphotransferase [Marinobacter sp. CHS3-4]MDI9245003.1 UDP-N-acetylglucosamine--undecaprenyl-phosphate N-acetylglucosaminephosphotransferase [Marinobacter sp. CHS3-4]
METVSSTGLIAVIAALFTLLILQPIARKLRLVDLPDHRKSHKGAIPLIGGLSAFAGLLVAWLISMPFTSGFGIYLLCALMLVILGAIDDARDVPAKFRLWAQVVLGALLSYGSGVYLTTFGNLLGFGVIDLFWLGPVVTIAAVIGATNAYNMIDGIDGLAGSLSLVTLGGLAVLFAMADGFVPELALSVSIMMALLPFMGANLLIPPFRRKIFMGDAGSMFIGFSVVWLLVNGAQAGEYAFRPVTALWVCAIPLMDMVAIMIRRARKGQSVMRPDRDHLHHIFLRAGLSDRQALAVITMLAILFALAGIVGEILVIPEWFMFASFMFLFAGYNWAIQHAWRAVVLFRENQEVVDQE